jgi:hypothetical protein
MNNTLVNVDAKNVGLGAISVEKVFGVVQYIAFACSNLVIASSGNPHFLGAVING